MCIRDRFIKEKRYRGYLHTPPVVNEKGKLIAGHHRMRAHVGQKEPYMWVAICHFDNRKAELEYNSEENQKSDTFAKKLNTVDDEIASLRSMKKELPNFTIKDLDKRISKLQKTKSEKRYIREMYLKKMNVKIDAHKPMSVPEIKSEYQALTMGQSLDTTASISVGDTPFSNGRLMQILLRLLNGQDLTVAVSVKDTESLKELNGERKRIEKIMSVYSIHKAFKQFTTKIESSEDYTGDLTLFFPLQYDSDKPYIVKTKGVK